MTETTSLTKGRNMHIQLKPKHEQFIQAQMASGRYENADDIIAKALKLLEEWEKGGF